MTRGEHGEMTMTELDHITVAAHTLEHGLAHIRAALGVELPYGGAHPRMATHNHLAGPTSVRRVATVPDAVVRLRGTRIR